MEKLEPITDIKYHHCLCCPPVPKELISFCRNGFGSVNITFGFQDPIQKNIGETVTFDLTKIDVEYFTLTSTKAINKFFAGQLAKSDLAEIRIDTPLHDETYQYNKEAGKWLLVRQGMGFA